MKRMEKDRARIEKDRARLWKPGTENGVSLFKAEFQKFSFKKHIHEDYALGVIEQGVQRFSLGGGSHVAPANSLITVNPGEVHDGESFDDRGYRYRATYIPDRMLRDILQALYGDKASLSYFRTPVTFDGDLAGALLHAHLLMEQGGDRLMAAETVLMQVVAETFIRHGESRGTPLRAPRDRESVKRAVDYIRENVSEEISLDDIAAAAGLSRYHFLRRFKAVTGLTPHAYLMQCRIFFAKRAIENGSSLSEAAFRAGFSDQSHFSRCFKAVHGITPGCYKKDLGA